MCNVPMESRVGNIESIQKNVYNIQVFKYLLFSFRLVYLASDLMGGFPLSVPQQFLLLSA